MATFKITPVPAPRQVRSDAWDPRPRVVRYRAFRDEVRARRVEVFNGDRVTFVLPMPRSWAKRKREAHRNMPHQQKPDLDNLIKALLDATHEDDKGIWCLSAEKVWGVEGLIVIEHGAPWDRIQATPLPSPMHG